MIRKSNAALWIPALLLTSGIAAQVVHVAAPANLAANSTVTASARSNPNALLQITAVWNPGGAAAGPNNSSPLGVWYRQPDWLIFNQDRSPMPAAAGFNIYEPAGALHRAIAKNINTNWTYLDVPSAGDPNAAFLVTPNWNPGAPAGIYNSHPIGVWYDASVRRWAIFNEDRAPMPEGAAFNVASLKAAIHTADPSNSAGDSTYVQPGAGDPAARLFITQVYNPGARGGVYNPHSVAVRYDPARRQWAIVNMDRQPIPAGASFTVAAVAAAAPPATFSLAATVVPPVVRTADSSLTVNPDALREALPLSLANPSFENGYTGWRVTGDAFGAQPNPGRGIPAVRVMPGMKLENGGIGGDYWRDLTFPIGVKGNFWASSGERPDSAPDLPRLRPRGRLTSNDFLLRGRYVSFLIAGRMPLSATIPGGGALRASDNTPGVATFPCRVELRRYDPTAPGGYRPIAVAAVENEDSFRREVWDLTSLGIPQDQLAAGVRVQIAVIDESDQGYISVDDFRLANDPPQLLAGTRRDIDHPVWGFADTHTHPAAHLGFGGKTIVGDPSLPLPETYATTVCDENHGGIIVAMGPNKSYLNVATTLSDPHFRQGAPDFLGYPRFNVKLHQQYHPDWFRRAFQGGERLVVALGVNNQYLATRAFGEGIRPGTPTDDHSQMLLQLAFIRRLVEASDFMAIAETPADARRIILSGKMAVVLGVETDNFGNFKDESYIWRDNPAQGLPLVTLSRDPAAARTQLTAVIRQYRALGARQFTSVHYMDGLFSGVPVFRQEPLVIDAGYTNRFPVLAEGRDSGVAVNIYDQLSSLHAGFLSLLLGGADRTEPQWEAYVADARSRSAAELAMVSTVNALGLTDRGRELMLALMREGSLIDSEHLSFRGKNDLFSLARGFDYPILSSHSDVAQLSYRPLSWPSGGRAPEAWGQLDDRHRWELYGTSNPQFLASEFQATDPNIDAIRDSGGVLGLFAMPYRKTPYNGTWGAAGSSGAVRNNADGSSKTWAQMFLYAAQRTGGRGIGLATDRAGVEQLGPRFGPYAAWPLNQEAYDDAKTNRRTTQRFEQSAPAATSGRDPRPGIVDKGVRYDRPIGSFHPYLYEFGDIPLLEEDMWKALAYITAYPTADPASAAYASLPDAQTVPPDRAQKVPSSGEAGHYGRIEAFVRGWHAASEAALPRPDLTDSPTEQAVFFHLRHNLTPSDAGPVSRMYAPAKHVFDLWRAMDGDNAPLRRLVTGTRHWDFNLDGMGNYGMLPDFLQDLRNVGINAPQMDVFFSSAEDYIRMWEKAVTASARVRP